MDKLTLRKIDRAKKFTLSTLGLGASVVALPFAAVSPVGAIITAPLLYSSAKGMNEAINNEYIKDSMMNVRNNGKITQEFPGIKQMLAIMNLRTPEQKENFLNIQEMNFFLGSDNVDKNGEKIQYSTRSHAITYRNLMKLQRDGYIENLSRDKSGKSRLILESLMMGNFKKIISNKQADMYNITFNKTGKELTEEYICSFLKTTPEELYNKYDVKKDKDGKISNLNYNVGELMRENLGKVKDRIKNVALPKKDKFRSSLMSQVNDVPNYSSIEHRENMPSRDDFQI